jgi:tetratricopeptide (TPR) repeat protein
MRKLAGYLLESSLNSKHSVQCTYFWKSSAMNILKGFTRFLILFISSLLLWVSIAAHAAEIEDAHKLFKSGQHSQALAKVNEYLVVKPKDAQARFLKGLILTEQGKASEAIKIFTGLTDDYPDLPEPYNNLAVLYASQGQYDKAKMLLEMAISTHPSYATAHENLGDIYAKMASQAYDRALQLDHGNATTQTKLAMIQNLFAGSPRNKESGTRNFPASDAVETSSVEKTPTTVAGNQSKPIPTIAATPAAKPSAAPVVKHMDTKKSSKEATAMVMAWAAAWSAKNTDSYLSFYAKDFKTPGGESRAAWEDSRRERINKPKNIHVQVRNLTLQFPDNDHAVVKFRQSYRSSHLKTVSNKTLMLVQTGNQWRIQEERSR